MMHCARTVVLRWVVGAQKRAGQEIDRVVGSGLVRCDVHGDIPWGGDIRKASGSGGGNEKRGDAHFGSSAQIFSRSNICSTTGPGRFAGALKYAMPAHKKWYRQSEFASCA
jgi:hypothetical protein